MQVKDRWQSRGLVGWLDDVHRCRQLHNVRLDVSADMRKLDCLLKFQQMHVQIELRTLIAGHEAPVAINT